jgi:chorismate dehydratase
MNLRLAAVSFLNTIPLVEWFAQRNDPCVALEFDLPSRLTGRLAEGHADVGLLPVAEVLASKSGGILPDACIASSGAVDSVKVFVGGDWEAITRVSSDRGSRSSVALLRILLAETAGLAPVFTEVEPKPGATPGDREAVLVIGDRCFAYEKAMPRPDLVKSYDLGFLWKEMTGSPFVFAAWAAAPGLPERIGKQEIQRLAATLNEARDYGLSVLPEIAAREADAGRLGVGGEATAAAIEQYFRRSLHYRLGDAEMAGIRRFHELSIKHGLLPAGPMPPVL